MFAGMWFSPCMWVMRGMVLLRLLQYWFGDAMQLLWLVRVWQNPSMWYDGSLLLWLICIIVAAFGSAMSCFVDVRVTLHPIDMVCTTWLWFTCVCWWVVYFDSVPSWQLRLDFILIHFLRGHRCLWSCGCFGLLMSYGFVFCTTIDEW